MLNRTGITDNSSPHQCVLALRSLLPALIYLWTCSTLCLISLFTSHVLVCTFLLAYCQDVKEALLSQIQAMFFPILISVFLRMCGAQPQWKEHSPLSQPFVQAFTQSSSQKEDTFNKPK